MVRLPEQPEVLLGLHHLHRRVLPHPFRDHARRLRAPLDSCRLGAGSGSLRPGHFSQVLLPASLPSIVNGSGSAGRGMDVPRFGRDAAGSIPEGVPDHPRLHVARTDIVITG